MLSLVLISWEIGDVKQETPGLASYSKKVGGEESVSIAKEKRD